MRVPVELDPDVDDEAPAGDAITAYDERHYVTYLRLLDAKAEGADWKEVARIVLHRDPVAEELRTYRCWQSHLERTQWLSREGYRKILEQAQPTRHKDRGRLGFCLGLIRVAGFGALRPRKDI
ncbi:DNA -binding domain-containing protein [Pseudogemmobacter humi]|uniref:T6SS Transcription factor RovC-like DNA binding domain-containing protein n=1 Tax=Pseudogemmobacter humi TaxID=2483812 RepID=A0A3P5WN12_9RHOB|nr:hypothetical protein XINFAN_00899 [Pseudogemmobacter humi]